MGNWTESLGPEAKRLDQKISTFIQDDDRQNIWKSVSNLLDMREEGMSTVMGLGYVQSGKTTSISALCASAADRGYQLIVAILGSTVILRDQNRTRVEEYLGLFERNYKWMPIGDFSLSKTGREIESWLRRDRVVLLPVIKNVSIIKKVAEILASTNLDGVRILVIDDEADQASLNTKVNKGEESGTFKAIKNLRSSITDHLYVQYTATPYAPLLLEKGDPLMPEGIEFLVPGQGYTGGREFFIENRERVIRTIPEADEQSARSDLSELPKSLELAIGNFLVGAGTLFWENQDNAPVSMLIHSTFKNDLQARYLFLVERYFEQIRTDIDLKNSHFGQILLSERAKIESSGGTVLEGEEFWNSVNYVAREVNISLVNSASAIKKINWHLAPFHILIGGNKLDRGFTVEGLTVTYMNRPASEQIDTLEQRARAFGYRTSLLPYCQFFGTAKTIRLLRGVVQTEDDLRANLQDSLDQGKSVEQWSQEVGLLLPAGSKPTRQNVIPALNSFNLDGEWHSLRKPLLVGRSLEKNHALLENLGIINAEYRHFGRLKFRTLETDVETLTEFLEAWDSNPSSPNWRIDEILNWLKRKSRPSQRVAVTLHQSEDGAPRVRRWADDLGFVNLFQGRDLNFIQGTDSYPGDRLFGRENFGDETIHLQIHHVTRRGMTDINLFTLAINLGEAKIVTKRGTV